MFRGKKQPVHKETEMTRPSATPPNVNPAMVSQLNKVARHAEDIQKQEEAESKTDNQHRKLTVGPGIRLKGEITDCDTLVVEGHVEISAKPRLIEIAETGTVIGDIDVKSADVSGRFDGDFNVNERLTIRSTALNRAQGGAGDTGVARGGIEIFCAPAAPGSRGCRHSAPRDGWRSNALSVCRETRLSMPAASLAPSKARRSWRVVSGLTGF